MPYTLSYGVLKCLCTSVLQKLYEHLTLWADVADISTAISSRVAVVVTETVRRIASTVASLTTVSVEST